jgi:hypothetical protein
MEASQSPSPSLDQVRNYECGVALRRFRARTGLSESVCREIFRETVTWLWLCRRHERQRRPEPLRLFPVMRVIDEMWHEFILCTRDYSRFCEMHLGGYVHHAPADPSVASDGAEFRVEELRASVRYVVEQLGPETATRWFREFPARFAGLFA